MFLFFPQIRKRKLEKADILELTVRHLKQLQKNHRGKFYSKFLVKNRIPVHYSSPFHQSSIMCVHLQDVG